MNKFDDVLQERLERLEAGESLASCSVGLSPEDAALLQLAAQLQKFEAPIPASATVSAQRAALLAATAVLPPRHPLRQTSRNKWDSWRFWQASSTRQAASLGLSLWRLLPSSQSAYGPTVPLQTQNWRRILRQETAVSSHITPPMKQPSTEPAEIAAVAPAEEADPTYTTFIPALSSALSTAPNLASLTEINGLVEVLEADGDWQTVAGSHALEPGTQIRTGALSSATLTFYDNSIATLGPDTGLTIEQLDAQRPETGFRTIVLNQWQGDSQHAVQFRNDGGSRYEVRTPDGSGLARGTKFHVNVSPEQFSRIAVTEGKVDVSGSNRTVSVTAGKLSTIPANEPPTTPAFTITGQGTLSATGDTWIIAGQAFVVNENTEISGDPQIGDIVFVSGHLAEDGRNIADRIELMQPSPANQFSLTGIVTEIAADTWLVAGQSIQINADTHIDDAIELGDTVRVDGTIGSDGSLMAVSINRMSDDEGYPFAFTGVVQQMGDDAWLISGVTDYGGWGNGRFPQHPNRRHRQKLHGLILEDQTWLATSIEWVDTTLATFSIYGRRAKHRPLAGGWSLLLPIT